MIEASRYLLLEKNLLPFSRYRCALTLGSRVQETAVSKTTGTKNKNFRLLIHTPVEHTRLVARNGDSSAGC
jgi:hypothetical protein